MRITGKVTHTFPTKKTSKGTPFTTFKVLANGEEKTCRVFGEFPTDAIWQEVEFEAEYQEQYKVHAVKGKITVLGEAHEEGGTPVEDSKPEPTKRRGRPKKDAPTSTPTVDTSKDLYEEAKAMVNRNLDASKDLLGQDASIADLVAVADMIGRTLVSLKIEAGKDRRTAEWKK